MAKNIKNSQSVQDQPIKIDVAFRQNDGSKRICQRCNRPVSKNGLYTEFDHHIYGPECIVQVQAALDRGIQISQVHEEVRKDHRKLMSETTKVGLAKRKQILVDKQARIDQANVDAYDNLAGTVK